METTTENTTEYKVKNLVDTAVNTVTEFIDRYPYLLEYRDEVPLKWSIDHAVRAYFTHRRMETCSQFWGINVEEVYRNPTYIENVKRWACGVAFWVDPDEAAPILMAADDDEIFSKAEEALMDLEEEGFKAWNIKFFQMVFGLMGAEYSMGIHHNTRIVSEFLDEETYRRTFHYKALAIEHGCAKLGLEVLNIHTVVRRFHDGADEYNQEEVARFLRFISHLKAEAFDNDPDDISRSGYPNDSEYWYVVEQDDPYDHVGTYFALTLYEAFGDYLEYAKWRSQVIQQRGITADRWNVEELHNLLFTTKDRGPKRVARFMRYVDMRNEEPGHFMTSEFSAMGAESPGYDERYESLPRRLPLSLVEKCLDHPDATYGLDGTTMYDWINIREIILKLLVEHMGYEGEFVEVEDRPVFVFNGSESGVHPQYVDRVKNADDLVFYDVLRSTRNLRFRFCKIQKVVSTGELSFV